MDRLLSSCKDAAEYPKNLVYHSTYEHNLKAYYDRLNERECNLFRDELGAAVDFWELHHERGMMRSSEFCAEALRC